MIWNFFYRIVDIARRTDAAKTLTSLLDTQWLTAEQLQELQLRRFKKLLIHADTHVEYYRDLFKAVGFVPQDFTNFEQLDVIPILTKDLIRDNFELLKADNFSKWQPRPTQTGGSTGKPLMTYKDRRSHSYLTANNLRAWYSSGYRIGDKLMTLAHGSLLPKRGSLKNQIYFMLQNSVLMKCYHMDDETIRSTLDIINKSSAQYIFGYSSAISLLAAYANKNKIPVKKGLKSIFTTSDMLYPHQRKLVQEVFQVEVTDIYGCPEGGLISFECGEHNGYHLNVESAYVEISAQNKDGLGKIISTPLFSYAFPMIRYDTGDVGVITTEKCSCGRELPRISELGGRVRDFIILRDGRHIHGAFFNHLDILYESNWINEYQVVQETKDNLLIRLGCNRAPREEELEAIRKKLWQGLLPDLKIDFKINGIEYTKGGKFRLIISKVKNYWD